MPDVVADSSPLQYLHRLSLLDLLPREYGAVLVPEAVVREIEAGAALGADVPDLSTLPWIKAITLTGVSPQHVDTSLGMGEREVIQLALLKPNPLVILDDLDARREAKRLSIRFTGVLGILLKAKQDGRTGDIGPLLDELQRAGFYLNAATRSHVLRLARELP